MLRNVHYLILLLLSLFVCPWASSAGDADPWRELGVQRVGPVEPPAFTLEDISGKSVSLKDFRGKVVLLNFWATWCTPCKAEMPALEGLHKRLGPKGLAVVAIDDYESKEKVLKYLKAHNFTFKILVDEKGKTSEAYKSIVLPTTFIIDREGRAVGKAVGARDWEGTHSLKLFEELLAK